MSETTKNSSLTEDKEALRKVVQDWIDSNPTEFFEVKPLYRRQVFDRCQKYIASPDDYLRIMSNALPEFMKWYLNVFETVFLAGLFGLVVAFLAVSLNEAATSFYQFFWIIPLAIAISISAVAILKPDRLSHWIQHRFFVRHNLNELNIELYYVSTIMKIRREAKE